MKRLLAVGAIVMTVAAATVIFVIPAMAHGTNNQTNAHPATHATVKPSMFSLEHHHGSGDGDNHSTAFSYSCASAGAVRGNKVIDVTESIANDADSGQAGNYWAFDRVHRSITIWNVGPDQYCAIVNYYD